MASVTIQSPNAIGAWVCQECDAKLPVGIHKNKPFCPRCGGKGWLWGKRADAERDIPEKYMREGWYDRWTA